MANKTYEIKVDKSIKPLKIKDRKPFDLIIGEKYYISNGGNVAEPCTLLWYSEEKDRGFPVNVNIKLRDGSTRSPYGNEIGRTPEEAVLNEVTW